MLFRATRTTNFIIRKLPTVVSITGGCLMKRWTPIGLFNSLGKSDIKTRSSVTVIYLPFKKYFPIDRPARLELSPVALQFQVCPARSLRSNFCHWTSLQGVSREKERERVRDFAKGCKRKCRESGASTISLHRRTNANF